MQLYSAIIENKELIKIFYGIVISLICFIIVVKTDRLFRISLHQGIRYFRNAFFFYGIAFVIRYIFGSLGYFNSLEQVMIRFVFEAVITMAGFFLVYSLLWKRIEGSSKGRYSSLFNINVLIFYGMAIIISAVDYLWGGYYFMFISQIVIFLIASIISYNNYRKRGNSRGFLKFYFAAMVLSFIAWILNAILAVYLDWNKGVLMNIYAINIIIFLLFLGGVTKFSK